MAMEGIFKAYRDLHLNYNFLEPTRYAADLSGDAGMEVEIQMHFQSDEQGSAKGIQINNPNSKLAFQVAFLVKKFLFRVHSRSKAQLK